MTSTVVVLTEKPAGGFLAESYLALWRILLLKWRYCHKAEFVMLHYQQPFATMCRSRLMVV